MTIRIVFLLMAVHLVYLKPHLFRPNQNCDYRHRVVIGGTYSVMSPRWPRNYTPATTCRWVIDSPLDYVCDLRCHIIDMPKRPDCFPDRLLVSVTGNSKLTNAKRFCGNRTLRIRSTGTRLTIGLKSGTSSRNTGGRFACVVTPQALIHKPPKLRSIKKSRNIRNVTVTTKLSNQGNNKSKKN